MDFKMRYAKQCLLAMAMIFASNGAGFSDEPTLAKPLAARTFPKFDRFGDPLPAGTLFRLGTERFRHRYVSRLVYSPDGKVLASITGPRYADVPEQQFAILWDMNTGKKLHQLAGAGHVAFTADGDSIAVRDRPHPLDGPPSAVHVGEMRIRVLEVKSGKEKFRLPADAQAPFAFSTSGDLVTAGSQGRVHVWSGADGRPISSFAAEGKELLTIAFSADGDQVVYADKEFVLRTHDRTSGKKLREVQLGPPGKVLRWDFYEPTPFITPDGRYYCDAGYDHLQLKDGVGRKNTLRIWDVAGGKQVAHLPGVMRPLPRSGEVSGFALFDVALSRDGKTLAYAQSFSVNTVVDVATGNSRDFKRDDEHDLGLAFSPDGKTLATAGGHSHAIRFWDVATGQEKIDPSVHGASVYALALSSDGRVLASGGRDYTIKLWDRKTGEYLHTFRGPRSDIVGLCFAPDGKRLASICHDGSLCFWNLATNVEDSALRKVGGLPARIVSYSPGGESIATLFPVPINEEDPRKKALEHMRAEAALHVWDVATGKEKLNRPLGVPAFFNKATTSRDGRRLAANAGKAIILVEPATGKEWKIDDPRAAEVGEMAFSHDGEILAIAERKTLAIGERAQIHLFSTATQRHLRSLHKAGVGVTDLAFSPDRRYLAGTYLDSRALTTTIRVWELASETPVLEFVSPLFERTLLFADDWTLFSGGEPSMVYAWGLEPPSWREKAPALPDRDTLSQAWAALAAPEGAKAYEATWILAAAGNQAVDFIREKLPPATRLPEKMFAKLLSDLDSAQFKDRAAAVAELKGLGPRAEGDLRQALAKSPSLEATRRIRSLLSELEEPIRSTEALQQVRAITVLERIATPEARQLLRDLSDGLPEARLTREAREASRRSR